MRIARRVAGFLRLLRPKNAVMAAIGPIVGWTTVRADISRDLLLAAIVPPLVLMAGNAVNDYFDVEIDRINKPWRPIPSGVVSRAEAMLTYASLSLMATAIAFLQGLALGLMAAAFSVAYLLYAARVKATGLPGNLLVSLGVACTLLYGALAAGDLPVKVVLFSLIAFTSNTARELVKGVEDLPGDSALGLKTFPITAGVEATRRVIIGLTLTTVVLTAAPIAMGLTGKIYAAGSTLACALLLEAARRSVEIAPESAGAVSGILKSAMMVGLLSMLLDNLVTL